MWYAFKLQAYMHTPFPNIIVVISKENIFVYLNYYHIHISAIHRALEWFIEQCYMG